MEKYSKKELIEDWHKNKERAEDICEFECDFCNKPKKTLIYVNDGNDVCCYHCYIKWIKYRWVVDEHKIK